MELKEKWKLTPDGLYAVSSEGRVRRERASLQGVCGRKGIAGKVLKLQSNGNYYHVRLGLGKLGIKQHMVHDLVTQAFLGPKPKSYQVNHRDGDKLNNKIMNLEYITLAENHKHAADMGLKAAGEDNGCSKLKEFEVHLILKRIATGESCAKIAKDFNVSSTAIYWIKSGRNWNKLSGIAAGT